MLKISPQERLTEVELSSALPVLVRVLENEDRTYQLLAAEAIGQIGPDAKAALPALRTLQEKAKGRRSEYMVIMEVNNAIQRVDQSE
jgi:hypothetical protein